MMLFLHSQDTKKIKGWKGEQFLYYPELSTSEILFAIPEILGSAGLEILDKTVVTLNWKQRLPLDIWGSS